MARIPTPKKATTRKGSQSITTSSDNKKTTSKTIATQKTTTPSIKKKTTPSQTPTKKTTTPGGSSQNNISSSRKHTTSSLDKKPSIQKKILPTPPSRKNHTTKTIKKPQRNSRWTLLIVGLGSLLLWNNREIINNSLFSQDDKLIINEQSNVLFVGKQLSIEGIATPTPGKRSGYTHTIQHPEYGTLALRGSNTINLYNYTGETIFQGEIKDFVNDRYIMEVTQAQPVVDTTQLANSESSQILYFSHPGLLIKDMSADGFTIRQQDTNPIGTITIENAMTNAQVNIRYFSCNKQEAYDCERFSKSFDSTVGVQFTDSHNNKFYKLMDATTWFVNLDNRYGVYIETSNEALLTLVVKNIQFITNNRAKNTLTTIAKQLCSSGTTIDSINTGTITADPKNNALLLWDIKGSDNNYDPATCTLHINPIDLGKSTLISYNNSSLNETIQEEVVLNQPNPLPNTQPVETKPQIGSTNDKLTDSPIPQIPLKPGKELSFNTKGLQISLPTPNIAFESQKINTTIQGLACSMRTNIIAYTKKSQINTNPAVVLYVCANGSATPSATTRTISVGNTTILVEAKDAAWINFVNNITVK